MFNGATAFDQPIGGWAVGKVRDFGMLLYIIYMTLYWMLCGASSFNQNLRQWTVDPGARTDGMLWNAKAFQKAHAPCAPAEAYSLFGWGRPARPGVQWKYTCLSSTAQTLPFSEQPRRRPAAFMAADAVAAAAPRADVSIRGLGGSLAAFVRVSNRKTNLAHRTK